MKPDPKRAAQNSRTSTKVLPHIISGRSPKFEVIFSAPPPSQFNPSGVRSKCNLNLNLNLQPFIIQKKQRLSSPSPDKKKLCVVVVRSKSYVKGPDVEIDFGVGSDEYQICILDPDSSSGGGVDEYTRSEPTIRFKGCFRDMAWCGLDSTLHLFEGVEKNAEEGLIEGTYAGKFEITPGILAASNHKLEKHDMVPIQAMRQRKIHPTALATPDGKSILVFSSTMDYSDGPIATFELYNIMLLLTRRNCSLHCPLNVLVLVVGIFFGILGYGFETDSRFVVMVSFGTFVLDLSVKLLSFIGRVFFQSPRSFWN